MKLVISLDIDGVLTNLYRGIVTALKQLPDCPSIVFSELDKLRVHKIDDEVIPLLEKHLTDSEIKQFKKNLFGRVYLRKIWLNIFNKHANRFDFVCITNRPIKYKYSTEQALKIFKPFIKDVLYKEEGDDFKINRLKRINAILHIDDDVDTISYLTKTENFNGYLFLGEPVLLNNKDKLASYLNVLSLDKLENFFNNLNF